MDQNQSRLVFFVFKSVFDGREYYLSVRRGEYFGFPGGSIGTNEDISSCAKRILSPIAWIRSLGEPVQIVGGSCTWANAPAEYDLFSLPDADIIAPVNSQAVCIKLGDDLPFDTFVDVFKRAMRKSVEIGTVKSAA